MKRSNLETIRRADAEAEKAVKRAKMLEERRAAKRASATPMDELEESATNAEVSAEAMLIAAEAVLTETRETIEALTVSALQQAHEMSHHPETTAESFFQAQKDMTVTSIEEACQKQLDFLESMNVFDEVYEDELPAGTRHVWPLGRHDENSNNVEIQVHCERLRRTSPRRRLLCSYSNNTGHPCALGKVSRQA